VTTPVTTSRPARFVIVDTQFVVPARGTEAPYYELVIAADQAAGAKRTTLITRDLAAAARALLVEGTETRLAITWRRDRSPRNTPRFVLEALS